jgi:hypothetical protein
MALASLATTMLARIELAARNAACNTDGTEPPERHAAGARVAREFPGLQVACTSADSKTLAFVLEVERWRSPSLRFAPLDEAFDRALAARVGTLRIVGPREALAGVAIEVLTRWQRHVERRNAASATAKFDDLMARHLALHDCSRPLVRADYDHAIDVWRWVLRLAPGAGLEVQAAALLHDLGRLVSEPDARIEQYAADHVMYKNAHAARGAELAWGLCAPILGRAAAERVARLIAHHERPADCDEDVLVLNDADALSFFSLKSSAFLDAYGLKHTARKVSYTLGRMRPAATRRLVEGVRLRPEIAALVWGASARGAGPTMGLERGVLRV